MDNTNYRYYSASQPEDKVLSELLSERLVSENISDYIIPDYVSDAERILLITADPIIDAKYISDGDLEIEGTVSYSLIVSTEKNNLSCLNYSEPFRLKTKAENVVDDSFICVSPGIDYVTAKLSNPRKINIRSQIFCEIKIYAHRIISPQINGTDSLDDGMNLQKHTDTVKTAAIFSAEERDIHVSHDMELDSGYPQAEEIIFCRAEPSPSEVKMRGQESTVRTDMQILCIYRTDDGNYFCADKKITLEKNIPDLVQDVEWSAKAITEPVEAKIASNAYGERKILELDFDYDLEMTAIKNTEISAVTDMYSTEYECEPVFEDIFSSVFRRSYRTNVTVNTSVPRAECDGQNVRSVFTGNVFIKDNNSAYNREKNKIVTEGNAEISLICENDVLVENELLFKSIVFNAPFKCEIDAGDDLSDCEFKAELTVTDAKFRADSQNIYADFELTVKLNVLGKNRLKYLSVLNLDKSRRAPHSPAPVTLCYPANGESLWDIAKYYKITEESIITANGLGSDDISGKKVLLIPNCLPKHPVFSKVI